MNLETPISLQHLYKIGQGFPVTLGLYFTGTALRQLSQDTQLMPPISAHAWGLPPPWPEGSQVLLQAL